MASYSYTERYVTSAGAGLADGTSEANAWSWATMLTSLSAGQRANVIGNVTTAAATQTFSNAGTVTAPMALRGMASGGATYSGDRDNATGKLSDDDNFPVITLAATATDGIQPPTFMEISELAFTSATTNAATVHLQNDYCTIRNCKITKTGTGSEALQQSSDFSNAQNCDIYFSGSSYNNPVASAVNAGISYCRIENTTAVALSIIVSLGNNSSGYHNQVFCGSNSDVAFTMSGTHSQAGHNSIRDCKVAFQCNDTTYAGIAHNNVAWGDNSTGSQFYDNSGALKHFTLINNAFGNFADANDTTLHETGSVSLTSDPFFSSTNLKLNNDTGGGADCKRVGSFENDLGAIQSNPNPIITTF